MEAVIITLIVIYAIVAFAHTVIWTMLMGFKWRTIWVPILMGATWLFVDVILIWIGTQLGKNSDQINDELDYDYSRLQ